MKTKRSNNQMNGTLIMNNNRKTRIVVMDRQMNQSDIEKKQTLTPKPSETIQAMDDHITIQTEIEPPSYESIDSSAQHTEKAMIDSSEKFQKPRAMSNVSSKI